MVAAAGGSLGRWRTRVELSQPGNDFRLRNRRGWGSWLSPDEVLKRNDSQGERDHAGLRSPMIRDGIDAFFAANPKTLPAAPVWRPDKSREGTMRARLPIQVSGALSDVELEMTVRSIDRSYLVIVLVARACICRLCIGSGHRNRVTGQSTKDPHFHRWESNRHLSKRIPADLPFHEPIPESAWERSAAFTWFLEQVGIESPSWLPVVWPGQGDLI